MSNTKRYLAYDSYSIPATKAVATGSNLPVVSAFFRVLVWRLALLETIAHLGTDAVRASWVEFLTRYEWDAWGTLTYRVDRGRFGSPGPTVIHRNVRYWLYRWGAIEATARGLMWFDGDKARGPYVSWVRRQKCQPVYVLGIENHASGRLHSHVLLRWPDRLRPWRWTRGYRLWRELYGRAEVVPPSKQDGCAGYVAKYVTKPGCELLLSRSFDAAALPLVEKSPDERIPSIAVA